MSSAEKTRVEPLSEVQRLRQELAQSEARFRDVIEGNADAIVVVDSEGVIRFLNRQAAKLFSGDVDELLGRQLGFPLVAGETTELDLLCDGQPVVVEMRVVETQWAGAPACIASLRDITERKHSEQHARDLIRAETARNAAEQAARRFRFLAESTTLLSASLDSAATLAQLARLCTAEIADWAIIHTFRDGKPVRLQGAHRDPAKADLIEQFLTFPIDERSAHPILEVSRTRESKRVEEISDEMLEGMLPDPAHRAVVRRLGIESFIMVPMVARERVLGTIALVSSDPQYRFSDGELALARDLASRAALALDNALLYEEARTANQAKTELLAIISHDLRTPLNSIIGYGQLLMLGIPDPLTAGTRERLERMLTAARHQLYLIDELLQFSRLDSRHEELQLQDVDVKTVVQEAAAIVQPAAAERDLALNVRLPEAPAAMRTDADKLRQVLINLLSNAVKYTQAGEITIEAAVETDNTVVFRVQDTGIGIAPEHLPHVFEPFWQVDRSQRTHGGGTGLGLSVVAQVVQLLGGRVMVDSTLGQGSTFTVIFEPAA